MSPPYSTDAMLASIQQTVVNDLLPFLESSRRQQFARASGLLLARLRTDMESAPALASSCLGSWRKLSKKLGAPVSAIVTDPLMALRTEVEQIARHIGDRKCDPIFQQATVTPGASDAEWFREIVRATRAYIEAYEALVPQAVKANESPLADPEDLRRKLTAYLKNRFPNMPADPVLSLKIVPGGNSKETSLFELKCNEDLPARLVLRRQLSDTFTGTSVFGEFSLLQEMDALGLPVPKPILAEKNSSFLDGAFVIVSEIVGASCAGTYFPELNDMAGFDASFVPDLTRALAKLHSLTRYPEGEELGGHHAADDPMTMVRNFQALWDGLANKPQFAIATELGFSYLLSRPLPGGRPRRMVHGDVGMHNLMVRDGRLAAILDWELAHLGDPAEDIGYIRGTIVKPLMSWDRFVENYLAEGGEADACNIDIVNWYSIWAHTRNSVYLAMVNDQICRGQRSDIDAFYASVELWARMQQYIVRELDFALGGENA